MGHAQSLPPATARLVDARDGRGGQVSAQIFIPVEPEVVWQVMLDCANAPRFVPKLRACSVQSVDNDGQSDVRRHVIAWLAGFPPVTVVFRSTYRKNSEIRFERISGDIAEMSGVWQLSPANDGRATNLTYEARLVPARLLPAALVRLSLLRDTPKVLEAVRDEALRRRAQTR